jgi:hypothetical protein
VTSFSDRELINRWIVADSVYTLPPELSLGRGQLLGFVYVDHMCGMTLDVAGSCEIDGEDLRLTRHLLADEKSLKMRYGSFRPVRVLGAAEYRRMGLPEAPDWLKFYRMEGVEPLRSSRFIDPIRAPGYPDDIRVGLSRPGMKGVEMVWARMERSDDDVHIECTLLNQPFESCDVSAGDRIDVVLMKEGEDLMAVCVGPWEAGNHRGAEE